MTWSTLASDVLLFLIKRETVADTRSPLIKSLRLVNKHWCESATKAVTYLNPHTLEKEDLPKLVTLMKTHFVNVTKLQVPAVWIDDESCATIAAIPQVNDLEVFWGDSITDKGLGYLSSASNLRSLKIYHSRQITDEGVKSLVNSDLEVLWLYGATEVTDEGLGTLSNLSSLKALRLMYCNQLTRRGLEPLVKREGLQIFVRYCRRISREILIS
eukprot:g4725.t1